MEDWGLNCGFESLIGVEMKVKACVDLTDVQVGMLLFALELDRELRDREFEATITSGRDGKHKPNSDHYIGFALDFRTWDIPGPVMRTVVDIVCSRLGGDYFPLFERNHLHVSYHPAGYESCRLGAMAETKA